MTIAKEPNEPGKARIDRYSQSKLVVLYRIILVSLSAGILLIPVILFFLASISRVIMSLILLAFVGLFGTVLCSATDAKTQDVFVGTAAYVLGGILALVYADLNRYAAVLVNFLGFTNSNQGCGNSTA